ncbi:MAG: cyclic nucleotide-binding domain-containing protein, partial [Gammaproteobacteria bacterium]
PHIDTQDRHIMWWGGLKGGLAVAIVLSIPDSVEAKPILVNLAVGVVLFTLLVNAPSIRPLMSRLGLDRLTPREREGLDEALDQARTEAGRLLDDWHSTGLLSAKGRTMALGRIADQLAHPDDAGNEALSCIGPAARALAAESTELERLRADHAISQYVYFDLRAELRRRIDRLGTEDDSAPADNPFSRFEYAVIRRLRERNWAAPLLAAYQRTRLVQQLQRRLGRLLMSRAALSSLMQDPACHGEITELMVETARQSVDAETASLAELRADFPAFYRRLESSLIPRAALTRAERAAAHRHEHGEVGTKVYNRVLDILHEARHGLPALKGSDHDDVLEMLQSVAFLAGLPEDALSALARHATEMSFLPGDMVIGEGEHGDALYLVRRGVLDVTREQQRIGALDEGEAFGEMALLGDAVRQATVTAAQSCVLLRLRRADVLKVADAYPELKQRLEAEQEKHRS